MGARIFKLILVIGLILLVSSFVPIILDWIEYFIDWVLELKGWGKLILFSCVLLIFID